MRKETIVLGVGFLIVIFFVSSIFAQDFVWEDISGGNIDFKAVLIDPGNPDIIYAGTGGSIIKTDDGGKTWRNVYNVTGQSKSVYSILFGVENKDYIYAATGNGAVASFDGGKNWKKIFKGKNNLERECLSFTVLPSSMFLGTKAGLFISKDKGRSWQKSSSRLSNAKVIEIAYSLREPNTVYAVCDKGIFRTRDAGSNWERIFVSSAVEENNVEEVLNNDTNEEESAKIRYISIDPNNLNNLYLITSRGFFNSRDGGETWSLVSSFGMLSQDANLLFISPLSYIYAVTKSGIFEYRDERWQDISLRLIANKIKFLSMDNQHNLYAACDNGLFKANFTNSVRGRYGAVTSIYSQDEPGIDEVQVAAIKYADVEPEKIKRWKNQAAQSALLPQVSVGLDRNVTDLWHWESGSTTKNDDDVLHRGKDAVEWGVNLSWDLSELIWNNDQTSIDVRSKLNVELRSDILDEVTKTYFERLRVKMDLDNISIEDRRKRFEKELRLQELTASLNALTGGYFSRKAAFNKKPNI